MTDHAWELELSELLTTMISPNSWATNGGMGELRFFYGSLVVRQDELIHAEIENLLESLRVESRTGMAQ